MSETTGIVDDRFCPQFRVHSDTPTHEITPDHGLGPYGGWRCVCGAFGMGTAPPGSSFVVKDSGKRQEFASGMVRDTQDAKTQYDLVFDGPMLRRFAEHLTKGAVKYSARNWMKAEGEAEAERFKASAARHFFQWMAGDTDEDHAAAVWFNINGYEYVKGRIK